MPKKLCIVYYSNTSTTEKMALEIHKGAIDSGVNAILKKVEQCTLDDLLQADGIVVGSPTYFSNIAWQMKKLIDESIMLYRKQRSLENKICGCFVSAGTKNDGKECLKMLETAFGLHHRMKIVPGIVLESKEAEKVFASVCSEFGRRIAEHLE
jgi:NAD(P)H dehydrogenase (quinone)